ncbi:MAG: hypothetical protein Q6352_013845 [Candidatus Freyrarchaeum guaymaensis]|nr:hypothetical protein [Candidatus Sigynarchaeota archaeon]
MLTGAFGNVGESTLAHLLQRGYEVMCFDAIRADTVGKILFVGGGKSCQLIQREYLRAVLDAMGIGMLPDSAFRTPRMIQTGSTWTGWTPASPRSCSNSRL